MIPFNIVSDFTDYGYELLKKLPSSGPSAVSSAQDSGHESDTSISTISTRSQNNKTDLSNCIFHCKKCSYKGNSKEEFIEQVCNKHKKTLYGCEVFGCLKTFESPNGFRMHCKNYHRQTLSCDLCGYVSVTALAKEEHIESHTKKPLFARHVVKRTHVETTKTDII